MWAARTTRGLGEDEKKVSPGDGEAAWCKRGWEVGLGVCGRRVWAVSTEGGFRIHDEDRDPLRQPKQQQLHQHSRAAAADGVT